MDSSDSKVYVRFANEEDLPQVYGLIQELAAYEYVPDEPSVALEDFINDGTGENPSYHVIVAVKDDIIVGIALYYLGYSTWKGNMLYLDDLVVKNGFRRFGIGKLLFNALVAAARDYGVSQVRWHVLSWNEPAIEFYKKLDATFDNEWLTCKLDKDRLYL